MNEQPSQSPAKRRSLFARIDWGMAVVTLLSLGAMAYTFWRDGIAVSLSIIEQDAWLFLTILPKVMLGCLIGALIRVLIAREIIQKYVGERSGLIGVVLAAFIGMLFPAGPFTIFPLAAVLLVSGADRGAAIAFISAWLLLGINRAIIWEMPFFGTDIVIFRFLISLPMPILLGMVARAKLFDRFFTTTSSHQKGEAQP